MTQRNNHPPMFSTVPTAMAASLRVAPALAPVAINVSVVIITGNLSAGFGYV